MSEIVELVKRHEEYRSRSLNLVASENVLSRTALSVLSTDLNGRYAADFYGGNRYIKEIIDRVDELLKALFNVDFASSKPVSGTISLVATILALSKKEDRVGILHFENGGFPLQIEAFSRIPVYLEYDPYKHNIDIDKTVELLLKEKPKLVILGASRILFPQPIREIAETVHDYGGYVCYDGSHVLGLIAGGEFQDPIGEGADVLVGSTHKTFPGPQGGAFLTNDVEIYRSYLELIELPFTLVDNPHVARIAALGVTVEEMLKFGRDYAKQVIVNAKRLAESLGDLGLELEAKELGYTKSHQIYISNKYDRLEIKRRLEEAGIFIDTLGRMGSQEVTRRGMGEREMEKIAKLTIDVISGEDTVSVRETVIELASNFNKVHYSFDE